MKNAEKYISEIVTHIANSPLRNKTGRFFFNESRSREDTQLKAELYQLADKCSEPLRVVLMGQVKSGKSSVLNALAGKEISPVNVTEATACIIEVSYAPEESAELLRQGKEAIKGLPCDIFELLTTHQNDIDFFNECEVVKIRLPIPKLKQLFIVDTPGLATSTEQNERKTQAYFQTADVVLWVLNGNYLGNSDVNDELRRVAKMGKPILVVLNRIDEFEDDIQECLEYVKQELGFYVKAVLPLSAKNAILALSSGNTAELEKSGFSTLMEYLENKIERQVDEVHNDSLISSARALLGRELLLHKDCLAEISGKQVIIRASLDRLTIKSQMIRETYRIRTQAWFSEEFLSEKERQLTHKINAIGLLDSLSGSGSQNMINIINELFSEQAVSKEFEDFWLELDRAIKRDWQDNLKSIQQEVAVDFAKFKKQYQEDIQAIIDSMPTAGKSALTGIGEGVAVAGAAGTALASYHALLGPVSAYVSMGSALSATMPPLLLAGAAAGAIIGVFNFKKEKSNFHRLVSEKVDTIRTKAKSSTMPVIITAIDEYCDAVVEKVQEQLASIDFEGLNPKEIEQIQDEFEKYCSSVEKLRQV